LLQLKGEATGSTKEICSSSGQEQQKRIQMQSSNIAQHAEH
jgi:hypothetical protein